MAAPLEHTAPDAMREQAPFRFVDVVFVQRLIADLGSRTRFRIGGICSPFGLALLLVLGAISRSLALALDIAEVARERYSDRTDALPCHSVFQNLVFTILCKCISQYR